MSYRRRGFMAYDMVAAIGVLSVVGFGAFQVYHAGIARVSTSSERSIAVRALANEWERLRAEPLEELGDFNGQSFPNASTELDGLREPSTSIEVSIADDSPAPYEVTLRIDWVARSGRLCTESMTVLRAF
jgi:hypothetical protein